MTGLHGCNAFLEHDFMGISVVDFIAVGADLKEISMVDLVAVGAGCWCCCFPRGWLCWLRSRSGVCVARFLGRVPSMSITPSSFGESLMQWSGAGTLPEVGLMLGVYPQNPNDCVALSAPPV